ncbi:hypothetical protein PVK06_034432 [Gossypium arboreum]|uniref:SWIM-type domain-containing protein n=1 Tax=Gossypium arboreum TaxID=29729 RepID=A0ABR0NE62_GOSAR|nr:hypothetical protein PVK06_034432 [Gossypium arboreum]
MSGSDAFESDVSNRIRVNLDGLNMDGIEIGEVCDSNDFRRLDSAHESDSDGQNWPEFNLENDMSNSRLKVGILFKSKDSLKEVAKQYVSLTKCRKGKLKALKLIEGAHKAQYEKIYEYLYQNEGTTTICYLDNRLFQRMYVYLQACKDGYRAGCRKITSLDGRFLKGYYGGYLLVAIGIDANNEIYPLAYAVVESENQASWLWFLELLVIDLEIVSSYQISFMSNKQKMILEARGKPILTMMETIRTKTMLLIVKKKEEADKWKGMLCPKIKKKLDVNIKDSLRCVPSHAGEDKNYVECGPGSQYVVDLVENSYSCKNWDFTGIPCMHALAVIHLKDKFPETYAQTWLKDIKLVFTTKWLSQLSNRLPQISKRVPQLNRLPQLTIKMLP